MKLVPKKSRRNVESEYYVEVNDVVMSSPSVKSLESGSRIWLGVVLWMRVVVYHRSYGS